MIGTALKAHFMSGDADGSKCMHHEHHATLDDLFDLT